MVMPSTWKRANVIPIHKKGVRSDPSNYRPVSLLNTTAKMFEKIIFKYLFNHFRDISAISMWQAGFVPGSSTLCQLLEIYHKFCQSIENGKEVRVVFLDISRAFDRVWHSGLLYKLEKNGIKGSVLGWIQGWGRLHLKVIDYEYDYITCLRVRVHHFPNVIDYKYDYFEM